jgi:hypothetical protein
VSLSLPGVVPGSLSSSLSLLQDDKTLAVRMQHRKAASILQKFFIFASFFVMLILLDDIDINVAAKKLIKTKAKKQKI